mgnify:CR=1 FL=1
MQLSKSENKVYGMLKENSIITFKIRELCLLLKISKVEAYNIVKALKKKGAIKSIGGFFALNESDEMVVASSLHFPSYISFWSALNYYGFSDQMPRKIFIATTSYRKEINGFKYVTLSKKRFFGYKKIGDIIIAEPEKAIADSLLLPRHSGGIREIMKVMKNALNEIEVKKLIGYSVRMGSKSVLRRLGFMLDMMGYKGKDIENIRKKIGKGYELLDPNLKRKNDINKEWLLDVNIK